MKVLGVVKVGRARTGWVTANGRGRAHPERVLHLDPQGLQADDASGRHWCFKAKWRTEVDAFWDAGIANGAAMTVRPACAAITPPIMRRFCAIPDGNRIEAVCHHAI